MTNSDYNMIQNHIKNYKYCLIGTFDFVGQSTGGQPVKSRELYQALRTYCGNNKVTYVEMLDWKKHPIKIVCSICKQACQSGRVIMLPAYRGLKILAVLLPLLKKIYHTRIYYSVIGGWLHNETRNNPILLKNLLKFDGIWVETSTMKKNLNFQGFNNVVIVPNFKRFKMENGCLKEKDSSDRTIRLIVFSRIIKQKGIEDAINAVNLINKKNKNKVFELDIYGPLDSQYCNEFSQLVDISDFVYYKGCAKPEDANMILREYDALLFPTLFYTEGIPGTIIDAYAAGIPVISSRWESFNDIIDEGITGYGYKFGDFQELVKLLEHISLNSYLLSSIRSNCLNKSYYFSEEYALSVIEKNS